MSLQQQNNGLLPTLSSCDVTSSVSNCAPPDGSEAQSSLTEQRGFRSTLHFSGRFKSMLEPAQTETLVTGEYGAVKHRIIKDRTVKPQGASST